MHCHNGRAALLRRRELLRDVGDSHAVLGAHRRVYGLHTILYRVSTPHQVQHIKSQASSHTHTLHSIDFFRIHVCRCHLRASTPRSQAVETLFPHAIAMFHHLVEVVAQIHEEEAGQEKHH